MEIDVVIDGAVTAADVFSFVFDVILGDPSIVDFVTVDAGPALSTGTVTAFGTEGLNGSDIAAIIGVTLTAPSPGDDDIPTGENVICILTFSVIAVGDSDLTFAGASCPPGIPMCVPTTEPTALDSTGGVISPPIGSDVSFDAATAVLSGS